MGAGQGAPVFCLREEAGGVVLGWAGMLLDGLAGDAASWGGRLLARGQAAGYWLVGGF